MLFANSHRPPWIRRTVWLTALLALLLFTGSIAVLESLVDNTTESGQSTAESLVNNTESEQQSTAEGEGNEELSSEDAKNYLYKFGYLNAPRTDKPADANALLLQAQPIAGRRKANELLEATSPELLKSAIRRFQEFAGLPPTGELDNRTKKKMKQPRCGVQDVKLLKGREGGEENVSKWQKRQLTYSVDDFTGDLPQHMQEKALQMAFDLWSRIVPLEFSESSDGEADIRIRFAREDHGDPWSFDGRGGDLAHATYPPHGLLHFDNDEYWAFMDSTKILSDGYIDLFWVSLHEIGHVIGLDHLEVNSAIMAPFYGNPNDRLVDWRGNYKLPELTSDDIRAAMEIYVTSGSGGNRRTGFIFHRVALNQRLVTSGGWTIQAGGLKASKTNVGRAHVHANQPFPVATSASPEDKLLYYFEVTFNGMTEYSVIIGLCDDDFPFTSTAMWVGKVAGSFAIENDGDYFASGTYKKGFAKGTFNNTDVVGCGLMVMPTERRLFFTKNGEIWVKPILLGAEDAKADLYPMVTTGDSNIVVEFNFGSDLAAKPFKYALSQLNMMYA